MPYPKYVTINLPLAILIAEYAQPFESTDAIVAYILDEENDTEWFIHLRRELQFLKTGERNHEGTENAKWNTCHNCMRMIPELLRAFDASKRKDFRRWCNNIVRKALTYTAPLPQKPPPTKPPKPPKSRDEYSGHMGWKDFDDDGWNRHGDNYFGNIGWRGGDEADDDDNLLGGAA